LEEAASGFGGHVGSFPSASGHVPASHCSTARRIISLMASPVAALAAWRAA
jgi:hypothetical protein